MNLKRKITDLLLSWKDNPNHFPLIIKGQRQIGKTFAVKEFAKKYYENVIYVDFRERPDLKAVFQSGFDIDTIISYLSTTNTSFHFVPKKTVIIFDEIQDCPQARTSLKYFALDKRFDVISTGSLLGIRGYVKEDNQNNCVTSPSVGYEEFITMHGLDFEEFIWANGIDDLIIKTLKECLKQRKPIPEIYHQKLLLLFKQYICIGGLPQAIITFLRSHDMNEVTKVQSSILESYKDDFGRHLKNGDFYQNTRELNHILNTWNSIPHQLAKENNKFSFSQIDHGSRKVTYEGSVQWLDDAGLVIKANNVTKLDLPLELFANDDDFKLYFSDTGLLTAMIDPINAKQDILFDRLTSAKGPIYENIIADSLRKMEIPVFFYQKPSGLELDFVIRYKNKVCPLEVKAKDGRARSLKLVLSDSSIDIPLGIKLTSQNIGYNNKVLTLPYYLIFLLND